jgi:peptidoglycan/LPS O-acetylase OafA/YrhL
MTFVGYTFDAQYHDYCPIVRNMVNGNFAVSIFIILSCYLLFHKISRTTDQIALLKEVIIKRYFRLMFSVGSVVVLMYALYYAGLFYADEYGSQIHNYWLMDRHRPVYWLPINFLLSPVGGTDVILNVGWMLGCIYFGNILCVIMEIVFRKKRLWPTLILWVILMLVIRRSFSEYYHYYYNVLFAYLLFHIEKRKFNYPPHIVLVMKWLCLVLSVAVFLVFEFYFPSEIGNMFRAMALVAIVFLSHMVRRLFSVRVLTFMGRISMGIYILQLMVIYAVTCRIAACPVIGEYRMLNMAFSFMLIVLVAWLFTKYLEPYLGKLTKYTFDYVERY